MLINNKYNIIIIIIIIFLFAFRTACVYEKTLRRELLRRMSLKKTTNAQIK